MRKQQVNSGNITFIQYNIVDKLTIGERVVHIMSNKKSKSQVIEIILKLLWRANMNQLEELEVFIKNYIL